MPAHTCSACDYAHHTLVTSSSKSLVSYHHTCCITLYSQLKMTYSLHRELNVRTNDERNYDYSMAARAAAAAPGAAAAAADAAAGNGANGSNGHAAAGPGIGPASAAEAAVSDEEEEEEVDVGPEEEGLLLKGGAGSSAFGFTMPAAAVLQKVRVSHSDIIECAACRLMQHLWDNVCACTFIPAYKRCCACPHMQAPTLSTRMRKLPIEP